MKQVIWCAMLLFLLAGCGEQDAIVSCVAEAELVRLEEELTEAGAESIALQNNLALWYNQNLLMENDPAFRDAYDTILFYSDGVMGSLEIPGRQIHLPIYHGTEGEKGFGHDPDTPFPIGGTGNHPVLTAPAEVFLESGDLFVIHILGSDLTYRVAAGDTGAVAEMDCCSIVTAGGELILGIRVA